jgi:polysaccharide deacetylase family protein (PEP-CTERM system associated)
MRVVDNTNLTEPFASWAARPVAATSGDDANALTIDVEDYFQVEAFSPVIHRNAWDGRECRIERNIDLILQMLAESKARGTFFTLGWVAERYPAMVRRIVAHGHELASHGLAHHRADKQSREEFFGDVREAKRILEDVGGVAVKGYRAASFSITPLNLWAFDALIEAGYSYSSSTYPIRHDLYGMPDAPRFAFYPLASSGFMEVPVTSVRRFGANWPCGGGGYFRLLPYWLSHHNLRSVKLRDRQPCIFYFHPWEIDPDQPSIRGAPLKARLRHYTNINKMQSRLKRLLRDFSWNRLDRVFPVAMVKV